VASEPEALLQVLTNTIYRFKRVGLEAGPLSQWLYSVLAEAGLPVICVETRHMRAMLMRLCSQPRRTRRLIMSDRRTVDSSSHDEFRLAQTLFVCDDGEDRILARGQIGARNLFGKDAIGALCSTVPPISRT
jgi:transposase